MTTNTMRGTNIPAVCHGVPMGIDQVPGGWAIGPAFGRKRVKKQKAVGSPTVWNYLPEFLKNTPFKGRI
mgnify:CR=1 FL=1